MGCAWLDYCCQRQATWVALPWIKPGQVEGRVRLILNKVRDKLFGVGTVYGYESLAVIIW